jgi:hypothetical protein
MLSAMGQQMQQYLWWKKHLTTLQIVSMMWFYFVPGIFIDKNKLLRKKTDFTDYEFANSLTF